MQLAFHYTIKLEENVKENLESMEENDDDDTCFSTCDTDMLWRELDNETSEQQEAAGEAATHDAPSTSIGAKGNKADYNIVFFFISWPCESGSHHRC